MTSIDAKKSDGRFDVVPVESTPQEKDIQKSIRPSDVSRLATSTGGEHKDLYQDEKSAFGGIQITLDDTQKGPSEKKANLGTFFGVFLPCCQNIVGVMYFVRFPWIVGSGGILHSCIIVGLCNVMSISTALSMSAIATNGKVTGGGTYFMISRSLGPTFGGSVGILFFIGTSISVAMYYIGTIEVLLTNISSDIKLFDTIGVGASNIRVYGTALVCLMTTVVFIGVRAVNWFALVAIVPLVFSIFSVLAGLMVFASGDDSVWIDSQKPLEFCMGGKRAINYTLAHYNNSWQCHNNISGRIFKAYCEDLASKACKFVNESKFQVKIAVPGLNGRLFEENLYNAYSEKDTIPGTDITGVAGRDLVTDIATSFSFLVSIYFPSITGVESGSNYSGDLRDPQISIPRGTLAAVAVTSTLYFGTVLLQGASVEGAVLRDKYGMSLSDDGTLVLSVMAWPLREIVLVGSLTATVGAGMQALAGGPRLLQAIACDDILPFLKWFAKKTRGEPLRGLIITFFIAETGILLANLDFVGPIVTMFFLLCYGSINFAVTLESLLDTPHWRPRFRYYHWSITLLGTAICVTTAFVCNWPAALAAICMAALLHEYIGYKGAEKEWGDGMTGLLMSLAIMALGKLNKDLKHTKNWRPQSLSLLRMATFENDGISRANSACNGLQDKGNDENQNWRCGSRKKQMDSAELINIAKEDINIIIFSMLLKRGRGLNIYASVLKGEMNQETLEREDRLKVCMRRCLAQMGAVGFVETIVSPCVAEGLSHIVQCAGLAALRPNTLIIGWPHNWIKTRNPDSWSNFMSLMRYTANSRKACIVVNSPDKFPGSESLVKGTLDIWWVVDDGGLMLLLANLIRKNRRWQRVKLRLFIVANDTTNSIKMKANTERYLYLLRIDGTVEVVELAQTDLEAYAYEKTLQMKQRVHLLHKLANLKQGSSRRASKASKGMSICDSPIGINLDLVQDEGAEENSVRQMQTAITLNKHIRESSAAAALVITNLPPFPRSPEQQNNYMSFCEVLSDKCPCMLFVKGTGNEVITVYN